MTRKPRWSRLEGEFGELSSVLRDRSVSKGRRDQSMNGTLKTPYCLEDHRLLLVQDVGDNSPRAKLLVDCLVGK